MQKSAPLTEAKKRDGGEEMDLDYLPLTPSHMPQSSPSSSPSGSASSAQSPFSRGYSRSSASSVGSSPAYQDSIDSFSSAKRHLTDVKEEPQEREEEFKPNANHFFVNISSGPSIHTLHNTVNLAEPPVAWDYPCQCDLADQSFTDSGLVISQSAKKRRSGDSPLAGVTSRLGTRFPSLSRKWKIRHANEPSLIIGHLGDAILSRSSSTGSNILSPAISAMSKQDGYLPPSPARTVFEESVRDSGVAPIDIAKANEQIEDEQESLARTPLLPPLMVEFPAHLKESPIQSPLPSPTVAEASTTSITHTPADTPRLPGLPSPPLSSRPSLSSLHRQRGLHAVSVDPPPITMTDPDDEWSRKLGHANFNIHPEPYLPEFADVESYKQLRANWDLARCNYAKHLVRTGEHFGATSKIYKLTEQKWAEIDAQWKHHSTTILSGLDETSGEVLELSQSAVAPASPVKIPPLNDPQGKFPELGDEDIVGPMTVGPVIKMSLSTQARHSRKRTFLKFLQDFKANTGLLLGRAAAGANH